MLLAEGIRTMLFLLFNLFSALYKEPSITPSTQSPPPITSTSSPDVPSISEVTSPVSPVQSAFSSTRARTKSTFRPSPAQSVFYKNISKLVCSITICTWVLQLIGYWKVINMMMRSNLSEIFDLGHY